MRPFQHHSYMIADGVVNPQRKASLFDLSLAWKDESRAREAT